MALLATALAAAAVRRRFSAALLLGAAGYAMAALFVVQGAPDLALTQVAIETLSTVLFVLVLRRLPDRFERRSGGRRRAVRRRRSRPPSAATVFVFALAAAGDARRPRRCPTEMIERAVPDGHGRNVVNVILVDFRGLDTLGEITVLAVGRHRRRGAGPGRAPARARGAAHRAPVHASRAGSVRRRRRAGRRSTP